MRRTQKSKGQLLGVSWPGFLLCRKWSGLAESPSFGNNNDTNIFCLLNNSQNEVTSEQVTPRAVAAPAEENLGNLVAARKVHDCFRRIIAFQDSRFYMEISREIQVFVDSFAIMFW